MKKFLSVMLLFSPSSVIAASSGIKETNYTIRSSYENVEKESSFLVTGIARFPVFDYTGVSIQAGYLDSKDKNSSRKTTTKSIGAGVFFRKYDLGIIDINYIFMMKASTMMAKYLIRIRNTVIKALLVLVII